MQNNTRIKVPHTNFRSSSQTQQNIVLQPPQSQQYQTPTGCPNKFGIMFWSSEMNVSEASIVYESYKKIVFCSKKLLFQPYFLSCKIENGFLKQLFPYSYVVIYLVKWRKVSSKSYFYFCSSGKKAEKAIFWSKIQTLSLTNI